MFLTSLIGLSIFSLSESVVFLVISLLIYSFFFQFNMYGGGMWVDSMSWSMSVLSLFLSSLLFFSSSKSKSSSMPLFIFLSLEIVILFFLSNSLMIFFMMFEMSLIPLMFLILTWGRQAERLIATQFMLIYTIVASVPLLFFVVYYGMEEGSSSLFVLSLYPFKSDMASVLLMMSMIAFFVKIPLFFLHSWLPKAHVEAPLEGSMILAGIMLKVGTFGMIRVMMISDLSPSLIQTILSISLIGSLWSSIIALSSDDMKMSVAFSSISHMNMVVVSILSFKMTGVTAAVIIMVAHGMCSPLLFYLVTKIYLSTHSRSILVSKGNFSKSPFLGTLGLLIWIVNMSTPPFFSFLGELMGFGSLISLFPMGVVWVISFLIAGSFYSIYNYGIQSHSSYKSLSKNENSEDMMFMLFSSLMILILSLIFLFSPPLYG